MFWRSRFFRRSRAISRWASWTGIPSRPIAAWACFAPSNCISIKSVALENIFVETRLDHATWQTAALTIHADLRNHSDREVSTAVTGEIGGVVFSENFALPPGATRSVAVTPKNHPQLNFTNAQLWWPWELGEPHRYNLKLSASVAGDLSDHTETSFGIREVSDYISPEGYRGYQVNGKKILIRGGGWADELLLREDEPNLEAQIQYTKAMNLNTIRLEGIWGSSQRLYDLADKNGLLIMAGFSCQWEWKEHLGKELRQFRRLQIGGRLQAGHQLSARPGAVAAKSSQHFGLGAGQRQIAAARAGNAIRRAAGGH